MSEIDFSIEENEDGKLSINDQEIEISIYLYFKNKLQKFIKEGFYKALLLKNSNEISAEINEEIIKRKAEVARLSKLTVSELNSELISGIENRTQNVFDFLVDEKMGIFEKYIYKRNHPNKNCIFANDAYQDAVLIVYQRFPNFNFNSTKSMWGYVFTCALRIWNKKYNKKTEKDFCDKGDLEPLIEDIPPTIYDKVEIILDNISHDCKEILEKYYVQKMSLAKIAKEMSYKSYDVAKTSKSRCFKNIRENLRNVI